MLRGLQDVLGKHQDACVAETRLRELAAGVELAEGVRPEVVRIADERGELAASLRAAFPEPYAAFRRRRPPT